jgi:hypothetical protein
MTVIGLKTNAEVAAQLEKVDWNFSRAGTWASALHSLHWFPGNFIPQIPSYLIQSLSTEGQIVFDPFCGSCTSGVEAVILGRTAWMSDFSPVSYLISESKLSLLEDVEVRKQLLAIEIPPLLIAESQIDLKAQANLHALEQWFHSDTLEQLLRLWGFVAAQNEKVRRPLEMLFSDTLFACASTLRSKTASGKPRRHHWGWVADNVLPKPPVWHDAVKYFDERLHRAKLIVSQLGEYNAHFALRKEDVRNCSYDTETADLVVTSPPYLGMIDYTRASRLTYLWQGWDIALDRSLEIGARSRRDSISEPEKYLHDIGIAAEQIARVLKSGGLCAIVIGSSRKYPETALRVVDVLAKHMELVWGPASRIPTRRRVSDRKGAAPNEYICVLRKR